MDLYNDLDEFIYHLSKVQFNHFNSDFVSLLINYLMFIKLIYQIGIIMKMMMKLIII